MRDPAGGENALSREGRLLSYAGCDGDVESVANELARRLEPHAATDSKAASMLRYLREHRTEVDRWHAAVSELTPAFAIAAQPWPDGVMAIMVRDHSAPHPRLVVFSPSYLDDDLFERCWSLFVSDEYETPDIAGRRVLRLFDDLSLEVGYQHTVAREPTGGKRSGTSDRMIAALLRRNPKLGSITIPAYGRASLLMLPTRPPLDWPEPEG